MTTAPKPADVCARRKAWLILDLRITSVSSRPGSVVNAVPLSVKEPHRGHVVWAACALPLTALPCVPHTMHSPSLGGITTAFSIGSPPLPSSPRAGCGLATRTHGDRRALKRATALQNPLQKLASGDKKYIINQCDVPLPVVPTQLYQDQIPWAVFQPAV